MFRVEQYLKQETSHQATRHIADVGTAHSYCLENLESALYYVMCACIVGIARIFGPKMGGVTEGWRKLHNEELHNLYSSPSIIRLITSRRVKGAGHVARMGEKRNVYRLLVGKPERKKPLGRPRCRRIDNIKMDLL
jgi:hypothetical protein